MSCGNRTCLYVYCALAALLSAPGVFAQDTSQTPAYGSTSLVSGFSPDPYVVAVTAGGSRPVSETDSSCTGNVAEAPDFSVDFTAGEYVLSFVVDSAVDTTLLVNDPDGQWHCNDDSSYLDSANAGIIFTNPTSGRYDIWVGLYDASADFPPATLLISEQNEDSWRNMVASLNSTPPVEPTPEPPQVLTPAVGNLMYERKL
jgi:hypothetical protein